MTNRTPQYRPTTHRGFRVAAFAIAAGLATALTLGVSVGVPAQLARDHGIALALVETKRLVLSPSTEVAIIPSRVVVVAGRDRSTRNAAAARTTVSYGQRG